jgi:hypothetical protein
MEPRHLKIIWLVIAFFIAGLTGYYAGRDSITLVNQQALFSIDEPFVPGVQTKNAGCIIKNSLPDPGCTPGAVYPDVTKEIVCVSGYTKTVRDVPVSLKRRVYMAYNVSYPPKFGTYELDHFIPLTLGGNNDISNLWPFPADPRPGFIEKNLTVNYLRRKVCAGEISLSSAQRAIATTWVDVYNNISPSEKAELNRMFPSWAETRRQ